jgi:ABC-type polysaccharide/polyol phosphate transport system ATPase subunit
VSIHYRREINRPTSLKEYVARRVRGRIPNEMFQAIEDVSLDVREGEVFGVVGRNGAGKSTLLRAVAGIIRPTGGRLRVWGRVTALLGVGAGFHPELTGRENVYLYSSLLGMTRGDTSVMFDDILEFSELKDFIDSPLRVYSTGMIARLGFAVAMARPPEIMLVDEVLGVGDEMFREKCRIRFNAFVAGGATILLVSHNLEEVGNLCVRAVWLHRGRVAEIGDAGPVVGAYRLFQQEKSVKANRKREAGRV